MQSSIITADLSAENVFPTVAFNFFFFYLIDCQEEEKPENPDQLSRSTTSVSRKPSAGTEKARER